MRRAVVEDGELSPLVTTQTDVPIRMCRGGVSGPKTRFPCHDTDIYADSCVSRRVSGPKMRFLSRDTDRVGNWSVSWQEAFIGCISRRPPSSKCARRTGHRQRGIRFCCAHSPLTGRCAQLACVIRHLAGPSCAHFGGKHRAADKPGDEYRQADYCFDATVMSRRSLCRRVILFGELPQSLPRRHCQAVHIVVVTKQRVTRARPADQ